MKTYALKFGREELEKLGSARFFEFRKRKKIKQLKRVLEYLEKLDEGDLQTYLDVGNKAQELSDKLYRSIHYTDILDLKGAFEAFSSVKKYFKGKPKDQRNVNEYLKSINALQKTLKTKKELYELSEQIHKLEAKDIAYKFINLYNQQDLKGHILQGGTKYALYS